MKSIRNFVNAQTKVPLERWFLERRSNASGEEGLRRIMPALPLIERLELYDEGYREIEQAQLDIIRKASADERVAAMQDAGRLERILKAMSIKEEYEARLLVAPDQKGVAAQRVLKRAPGGLLPDEEDLVFDAIWALSPAERRTFYEGNEGALRSLLSEGRLNLLRSLVAGTELEAIMARLKEATEGRIDDQEAIRAIVDRAAALLAEKRALDAAVAGDELAPKERKKAEERLAELGDLKKLLDLGAGKVDPNSFLGRLSAAESPDTFGAMAQKVGSTITDPAQQEEFAFRIAKERVLKTAGVLGADEDAIRNAMFELRAPPVADTEKLTSVERAQRQNQADSKLRQRLREDKEVKDVLNAMPGSAQMRLRDYVAADPFTRMLVELNQAFNAAEWGQFFQLVLQIALREDWRLRFQETAGSPLNTYPRVRGKQREIMLDILKNKRIPSSEILGFTGDVETLRTALSNLNEAERGQLRLGYLVSKSGAKRGDKSQDEALGAYHRFYAELRKSQSTWGHVDVAGMEAVLDAALGSEPTAKEMESGEGMYGAATLMYERQQAQLALRRGLSTPFTETDETMEAAARQFAAVWLPLRDRMPHKLQSFELAMLSNLHAQFTNRSKEFTEASNAAGEIAGMIAATIAGIIIVAGTGGVTAPGVIAALVVGGEARVVTREMFGQDFYDPAKAGARDAMLGGIDAALAVVGGSLGTKAAQLVGLGGKGFLSAAARVGGEVAEQASAKLPQKVAAGAVEAAIDGAISGFVSEAANAMTDAQTSRRGVWEGLVRTGQSALVAGLSGLVGGAFTGGLMPVAGRGVKWARESVATARIEAALNRAEVGGSLDAARKAARAGNVETLEGLLPGLEKHLTPEEGALLRNQLYSDLRSSFGRPPGRAEIVTIEEARVLGKTARPEANLTKAELDVETNIVGRSTPQPSTVDGYLDEVALGNGHTWRRRSNDTWCRFSGASFCGIKIPGSGSKLLRPLGSAPPFGWPEVKMTYETLPRDSAKNILPLPEGVVYEFPGGNKVWKEGEVIRHESVLGPKSWRRKTELEFFSASETGRPEYAGMQRAHTLGQSTGFESPWGIFYAPPEVNQKLQNNLIEELLRGLRDTAEPGEIFNVATMTTPHPGTLLLKDVRYEVAVTRNGKRQVLFQYVIEVGKPPSPSVKGKIGYVTPLADLGDIFDRVSVPDRLKKRFAKYRKAGKKKSK